MRMKELETRTGVSRETIRFYLRQGLLPEPERPKRNVAVYSETHVRYVLAIKRLQEERFLPLGVIKALMQAEGTDETVLNIAAFPHLDGLLSDRLGREAASVDAEALGRELGQPLEKLYEMDSIGLIRLREGPDGRAILDARDAAIVRRWADLRDAGFTEERGFTLDKARIYVEFVDWLVGQEVRLFYDQLAGQVGEEEAAGLAAQGVTHLNDILALMRTRAVLDRVQALIALDPKTAQPAAARATPEQTGSEQLP